jgi:hypothetical protein
VLKFRHLPILTTPSAAEVDSILSAYKVQPWQQLGNDMRLSDYTSQNLTPDQKAELKFAPEPTVRQYNQPNGEPYTAFLSKGKSWVGVAVPLQHPKFGIMLPLVFEFNQGVNAVTIGLPAGVPGIEDQTYNDPFGACGMRETEEETGITLSRIVPVNNRGITASARKSNETFRIYLGIAEKETYWREPTPDRTENLVAIAVPWTIFDALLCRDGALPEYCQFTDTALGAYPAMRMYES